MNLKLTSMNDVHESSKGGGLGLGRWKLWCGSSMDPGTRLEADWVAGLGEVPYAGPAPFGAGRRWGPAPLLAPAGIGVPTRPTCPSPWWLKHDVDDGRIDISIVACSGLERVQAFKCVRNFSANMQRRDVLKFMACFHGCMVSLLRGS